MKTAAVVMDTWKLPIFKRHLDAAGYQYQEFHGITESTKLLKVKYMWVADLQPIIEAANTECANARQTANLSQ